MKKLALILALLIIPCSAFGLEMLDNNAMDTITGQAGVNIAFDDVQIFMNIEKIAWIDCDGFQSWEGKGSCSGAGGAIVLNNFQLDVLNVNAIVGTATNDTKAILTPAGTYAVGNFTKATNNNGLALYSTSCGKIPLFYDYATSTTGDGCQLSDVTSPLGLQNLGLNNYTHYNSLSSTFDNTSFVPHFLTIDVTDALPASTEGFTFWRTNAWTSGSVAAGTNDTQNAASTVGGVLIGIPTVEIYIQAMSFTPLYDGDLSSGASTASNDDNVVDVAGNVHTFGTIYMQGITFTTLGGWVEISPK